MSSRRYRAKSTFERSISADDFARMKEHVTWCAAPKLSKQCDDSRASSTATRRNVITSRERIWLSMHLMHTHMTSIAIKLYQTHGMAFLTHRMNAVPRSQVAMHKLHARTCGITRDMFCFLSAFHCQLFHVNSSHSGSNSKLIGTMGQQWARCAKPTCFRITADTVG